MVGLFCYCFYFIATECACILAELCCDLWHACRAKLCCGAGRPAREVELSELDDAAESDDDGDGGDDRSQTFVTGGKDRVAM